MSYEYATTTSYPNVVPLPKPDGQGWRFRHMQVYELNRSVPAPPPPPAYPGAFVPMMYETPTVMMVVVWERYIEEEPNES